MSVSCLNRLWFGSVWGRRGAEASEEVASSQSPLVRLCLGSRSHYGVLQRRKVSIAFGSALFGVPLSPRRSAYRRVSIAFGSALFGVDFQYAGIAQWLGLNRLWFGSVWGLSRKLVLLLRLGLNRLWFGSVWGPIDSVASFLAPSLNRLWFGSVWGLSYGYMLLAGVPSQSPLVRLCLGS